ncbi:MAG: hypothetical protein E3J37_08390 [Anaerolineales bacterium]|nr:MAG: hypothetical protein E3J37_08390 [Anaerolineales bacterium]
MTGQKIVSNCENCSWRKRADENPGSIIARLWRWHTTWCPMWKAYQKALAESDEIKTMPRD